MKGKIKRRQRKRRNTKKRDKRRNVEKRAREIARRVLCYSQLQFQIKDLSGYAVGSRLNATVISLSSLDVRALLAERALIVNFHTGLNTPRVLLLGVFVISRNRPTADRRAWRSGKPTNVK